MRRTSPFWLALITLGTVSAQELPPSGPLPELEKTDIEYHSVAEALTSLKARPDVTISTERGWTIITDKKNLTIWSFAPDSYPAHPAVVKRAFRDRPGGGSDIDMSVLCEASKEACDQLVREFDAMNQRLPPLRR
jgi:hypothetical protein